MAPSPDHDPSLQTLTAGGLPAGGPVAGAPSDNDSLVAVLAELAADGFDTDLHPAAPEGDLRCAACGTTSPAAAFGDCRQRRLEGASDPDDMVMVLAASCPACGRGGVAVLGYGPASSEEDVAVMAALQR